MPYSHIYIKFYNTQYVIDYINVHIAGTDTETDTDTLMMANECLG